MLCNKENTRVRPCLGEQSNARRLELGCNLQVHAHKGPEHTKWEPAGQAQVPPWWRSNSA
jgi:hypothetical protein